MPNDPENHENTSKVHDQAPMEQKQERAAVAAEGKSSAPLQPVGEAADEKQKTPVTHSREEQRNGTDEYESDSLKDGELASMMESLESKDGERESKLESHEPPTSAHSLDEAGREKPKPPVTQSREELDVSDEYGWDSDNDGELVSMMEDVTLKDGEIRKRAEERVRIVQPIAGEGNGAKLVSPGQFEKEHGSWPQSADYDEADAVLVMDEKGLQRTRRDYYRSLMEGCRTPEDRQATHQNFKDEMADLGLSSTLRTSGHDLGNILLKHEGQETLHNRADRPDLRDATLEDLTKKYGDENVRLRMENGAFATVNAIEQERQASPNKLAYTPEQLFRSFEETRPAKAYVRTGSDTWVPAETPKDRQTREVLLTSPHTHALLTSLAVSKVNRDRPETFGNRSVTKIIEDAGLDPSRITLPRSVPEVMVRMKNGNLVSGKPVEALSGQGPLTGKVLKDDIYLQNYGTVRDERGNAGRGPTGNFSTLADRERRIQHQLRGQPPGAKYAALYYSLETSQRTQLKMPAPGVDYQRSETPALDQRGGPTSSLSFRTDSQMSTSRDMSPSVSPAGRSMQNLSVARQMFRPPRSSGRGE
ncbi:hypothetical protein QE369_002074 [Agrobacterium larrymoorei]|uniref:Uncharacterized protein n=1 Tax=Agrobacterium larrymoorei TaxID=160699 RepID=A0AAJ2EUW5_9HYPH|nr:hypothetical protein [Agrobacterium larrymoorei]MDR6101877.1 hypothetical protein [Agrobacterium larrymoorei]